MKNFEEKLVDAIRQKRNREGLSIRSLANVVGVSFSTLARIERGEGSPDNNSKIRLLEWLGADAHENDLRFDEVAFVHFRAGKNVASQTIRTLLSAAVCLRDEYADELEESHEEDAFDEVIEMSKEELENTADRFRSDLGLRMDQALDSLSLKVDGVIVEKLSHSTCIDARDRNRLSGQSSTEWSAMSVPLNAAQDRWVVLLNDQHTLERQRVTLLEEYWHILLGHKLVKIAKIAEAYGRTYDSTEEHDAYYLASASLLPRQAMQMQVSNRSTAVEIANRFGTSPELVEYRIKRLGLWRDYKGKHVALS